MQNENNVKKVGEFQSSACRRGDGLHLYRLCHLCQSNERKNETTIFESIKNWIIWSNWGRHRVCYRLKWVKCTNAMQENATKSGQPKRKKRFEKMKMNGARNIKTVYAYRTDTHTHKCARAHAPNCGIYWIRISPLTEHIFYSMIPFDECT